MHILFLTTAFPRYAGDYRGQFILELAKALMGQGQELSVIAPLDTNSPRWGHIDGIPVSRFQYAWPTGLQHLAYRAGIPTNLRRGWLARLQVPFFLGAFARQAAQLSPEFDLIHAFWPLAGFAGWWTKRLRNSPLVVTIFGTELTTSAGRWFTKLVLDHCDACIVISEHTLQAVQQLHPRCGQVRVIPFGVDKSRLVLQAELPKPLLRQQLGLDPERPLIFALGMLVERKGFDFLIDAVSSLALRTDVQVVIGGEGPLRPVLEQHTRKQGLQGVVELVGRIPAAELPYYYRAADLFVHPAVTDCQGDTEGLGLVIIEAMLCGTSVVASATGGITDIIDHGRTGLLVPERDSGALASAIASLLEDSQLRAGIASAGQSFAEAYFSWPSIVERTLQVYNSVLAQHKSS